MDGVTVQKPVVIIGGPTASGKSGLALTLAEQFSGVVINADSMQIYRGLPILTAQPTPEEKAKVPHRLYATQDPGNSCSAVLWRDLALEEINQAHADNKLPVIVGGTGFYLKILLQGISPIPDIPHNLRDKISCLQKKMGNPVFHQELAKRDPIMASRLHPFNTQRLVRAWEVLEATGKSLAEWQALPRNKSPENICFLTIVILPRRDSLYAACNTRFEHMLKKGALDEVKKFRQQHSAETALAKALGYPELCSYLNGKISQQDAIRAAQQSTRHYAKRQMTWFRHQTTADLILGSAQPAPLAWVNDKVTRMIQTGN
ncbi:MAG: tRNA (adenosine(37)-N6)-dimethylallyltransferase MiaA [Proteobacteria bacterium]|nr:tRNA (adenosine(37)-N6)-dimethylallyltransferase MiaA [Pseudomonadota bacterium]